MLSNNAEKVLFATYFGGNKSDDHVDGGTSRFDKKGVIYQSVCASCGDGNSTFQDFPISSNAVFNKNLSPSCSNAAFKISFAIKNLAVNYNIDTCAETVNLIAVGKDLDKSVFSYLWTLNGKVFSTDKSPVISLDSVKNKTGLLFINKGTVCEDSAEFVVQYNEDIKNELFANVFSPNNDGVNDVFEFKGVKKCVSTSVIIYNRWGNVVFKSDENNFKWDGKAPNGEDLPEGVYFCILHYKKQYHKDIEIHSTITILR
jgi:gliding motility-associated-like protein